MQDIRSLFENLGLPYFKIDTQGVLVEASDSLCAFLGYACDQMIGRKLSEFIGHSKINEMMIESSAHRYIEKDLDLRRNGRSTVSGRARLARLEDEQRELVGYYGVLQDITAESGDYGLLKYATDRDKAIARRIQESFLPSELPEFPGWELATYFEAAQDVAGDFYDAFPLAGGKRMGVVIADVCDKGIGSALFMALIRSLLRAFADQHYTLGWMDVLDDFNQREDDALQLQERRKMLSVGSIALKKAVEMTHKYVLENHGHTNMFATLFFAVIDPATGVLAYINAGHDPPIVLGEGRIKCRLEPTGIAIGLPIEASFQIQQIMLEPGDVLFAYTDGVTDARNNNKEFFTEKQLLTLLQEPKDSAAAQVHTIAHALEAHTAGVDAYDDITIIAVRRSAIS